jgi:hypothetical protein
VVTGLEKLPEAERIALYESVCADLQMLETLTEKLARLSALLAARDSTRPSP